MSNKLDRALHGPSLFEVTLGALLSVGLGAVIALLFLVFKPVVVAKEMPKEEDRVEETVYYVEGKDDASRDRQWIRKRQLLLDGTPGDLTVSEDEINACLSSGAPKKVEKKAPPTLPGAKPAPAPAADVPDELLTLDVPNVRIRDSVFQVGVPASLNLITFSVPVVLQAQGTFVKADDMWEFVPSSVYLGSMPLHRIPGLTRMMMKRIARSNAVPDEAMAAWKRVSSASLSGRLLHLTVQPTAAVETAAPAASPADASVPAPAPSSSSSASSPAVTPSAGPTTSAAVVTPVPTATPALDATAPAATAAPAPTTAPATTVPATTTTPPAATTSAPAAAPSPAPATPAAQ